MRDFRKDPPRKPHLPDGPGLRGTTQRTLHMQAAIARQHPGPDEEGALGITACRPALLADEPLCKFRLSGPRERMLGTDRQRGQRKKNLRELPDAGELSFHARRSRKGYGVLRKTHGRHNGHLETAQRLKTPGANLCHAGQGQGCHSLRTEISRNRRLH